ncbi:MAG: GNAT family N-acetyltransferase [Hydrococcus sp. Prado102]|jgi:putative acetyltransferase|nr:GNAT family N-acetyltransferase [Hydrococcus sp. Prado102]
MNEIVIRAFEMSDWEDIAELWLSPNCRWGTLQLPYQSRDDIKKKLENPSSGIYRLVAAVDDNQKVVGMASLHTNKGRRAHVAGLGMFVRDDYQHQGIGSRLLQALIELAQRWLNLKRLELTVYIDNPAAIHLYKKYGFAIEGTLKKYAFRDGIYIDAYTMARVTE